MQKKTLPDTTMSNYGPKARRCILFCEQHQRPWLPTSEATVLLYIASLLKDGGIKSASLQPYLSAINNYHEDLRFPGPAKGRSVTLGGDIPAGSSFYGGGHLILSELYPPAAPSMAEAT
ncbi:hypothetical protein CYMTET_53271 [Cymbomonas tetramitiformis]|uniref:Core-binding (CB) domain-containing protein n=1 Tax=Cymbomonas tetramitiformis TaxID=36881 RepID=A0AAE0BJ20_9CHLO|nr:hypothetical protein CYMTET_53271 [Cymbomonas tetramitiformis]